MSFNGWKRVKLKDCVSFQEGYVNPSQSVPEYFGNEIKWLRANDLNNSFVYDTSRKLSRKGFESAGKSAYLFKPNSLAISKSGTIGRLGILQDYMCGNRAVINIEVNNEVSDTFFIFYNLLLRQSFIEQMGTGSVQKNLYISVLGELEFDLPDLSTQRRIVDILSALDEKIELNRQTNVTLEAIAQSIFREWFLDNEDVVNWEVAPLPEVINLNVTRTLKKGSIAPYLDMANMPTQGHRAIEWRDRPFGSGTKFVNGDTLLARITPCLENGKTAFVDFLEDGQVGWGSTEYIVFSPKPPLPPEYGYYLARTEEVRNHAIQNMIGTSGRQRASASCFDSFIISVPPAELAARFGEVARSLMTEIKTNDEESRTLASIRDALLPKLMSGELSVKG